MKNIFKYEFTVQAQYGYLKPTYRDINDSYYVIADSLDKAEKMFYKLYRKTMKREFGEQEMMAFIISKITIQFGHLDIDWKTDNWQHLKKKNS